MNGTNECIFTGTVGKDPKIVGATMSVMKFSIGVGRDTKKNADGTWSGNTDWVQCVLFKNDPTIKKGTSIKVWGSFRNNNWEKDGVKRYDYQINVQAYFVFEKKSKPISAESPTADQQAPDDNYPDEEIPL